MKTCHFVSAPIQVKYVLFYISKVNVTEEGYKCPLCEITTEQLREIYPDNYRSIFSEPRTATQSTGCVWKVHADSCCVDVSFAMFSYVYHIPAKLLQLADSDNSVT